MQERADIKKAEFAYLADAYAKDPSRFAQKLHVEDAHTLSEFGIWIPQKESCPVAMLKLWPEDFIVEERVGESVASVTADTPAHNGEGATVYATLVKCGLSTIEAIEDIAKKLNIRIEDIGYAGIKDKDAVTAQRISIRRASLEGVAALRSPHFRLTEIAAGSGAIGKGSLTGNRFTIFMRTQESFFGEEETHVFNQKIEALQHFGFYNFFYLQRFGTPRLHNFAWALMILKGNYKEAVRDIICFEGERELPFFIDIRRELAKRFGDWDSMRALIEPLPLMFRHEHRMLAHLSAHPDDFRGALQQIPEQITLWMYALSSLLFNQHISNCLMRGKEPPEELPFFLSREREDYEPYKDMLQSLGIYPPSFEHLKPFPQVMIRSRKTATRDTAKIGKAEVVDGGVILQFELGKGQYATTFLSHLFTLTAGILPDGISMERVDTKALLGEPALTEVLAAFEGVISKKGENAFETLLQKGE
jgi:tRNA pseudouridine13 synthase